MTSALRLAAESREPLATGVVVPAYTGPIAETRSSVRAAVVWGVCASEVPRGTAVGESTGARCRAPVKRLICGRRTGTLPDHALDRGRVLGERLWPGRRLTIREEVLIAQRSRRNLTVIHRTIHRLQTRPRRSYGQCSRYHLSPLKFRRSYSCLTERHPASSELL